MGLRLVRPRVASNFGRLRQRIDRGSRVVLNSLQLLGLQRGVVIDGSQLIRRDGAHGFECLRGLIDKFPHRFEAQTLLVAHKITPLQKV